MISRRVAIRSGFASLVAIATHSHTVGAFQASTPEADGTGFNNLFHGNLPDMPHAAPGSVEVILAGFGGSRYAGVVVHNASDQTIGMDDISGIARDAGGSLFAVSDTSILAPSVLEPGEYGLGLVSFDKDLTADTTIDFSVKTETPGSSWIDLVDIPIMEINVDGNKVIGVVENTTDLVASSLVAVVGVFFDIDGQVCGWFRTYLNDSVEPGGIGTFNTSSIEGTVSDSWAMAASGWAG